MDPLPRVLYVTHRVPFPPDKGDRIRNYHVLRQLAKRARVWLLALADEPVPDATRTELARLCERVEYVPVGGLGRKFKMLAAAATGRSLTAGAHASMSAAVRVHEWAQEAGFAGAVVSSGGLAGYLRDKLLECPRVVDLVDVDSQKWLDFAASAGGPKRWLYRFEAGRTRAEEKALAEWADAVTIVARHEADVFDAFTRPGAATVATNGVDLDYWHPTDVPEQQALAFVGALDYLPNVDAAGWFARDVWPQLREQHPDAELRLIGRKPAPAVQALAAMPGVRVVGQVPDVRPHLATAAVVVVPMRLSRGLQNKVLEALAMGKATVAAPPALAALKAVPGEHLLRAESPAEWVSAVNGLLDDPARRRELGLAGRRFVEANHHWDTCLAPLVDAVVPARVGVPS
jgi:sugar transferase (PEP-CTERM/EpsH1 system associated)